MIEWLPPILLKATTEGNLHRYWIHQLGYCDSQTFYERVWDMTGKEITFSLNQQPQIPTHPSDFFYMIDSLGGASYARKILKVSTPRNPKPFWPNGDTR